jgi:hypothetical protein
VVGITAFSEDLATSILTPHGVEREVLWNVGIPPQHYTASWLSRPGLNLSLGFGLHFLWLLWNKVLKLILETLRGRTLVNSITWELSDRAEGSLCYDRLLWNAIVMLILVGTCCINQ